MVLSCIRRNPNESSFTPLLVLMKNILMYLAVVLIWGTTWLAIKFQLGEVSPEVSIFYRFAIASVSLLLYCKLRKTSLRFKKQEHLFLFLLGAALFSINFIFIYKSTLYLISGLVSVVFSLVSLFNIINSYLFFKKTPEKHVVLGGILGLIGIITLFWKSIFGVSFNNQTLLGICLALIGTLIFSLGNIISSRNQKKGMRLVPGTAIAMAYGASIMLIYVLAKGLSLDLPPNFSYWISLLYLAIPGSVIAFLFYLGLVSRIGPEKAGYATIFFPLIALTLSYLFETYRWSWSDLMGVGLILFGNYVVMYKRKQPLQPGPS